MNVETSYIHKIKNGLRFRYYGGRVMSAVSALLRRPAAFASHHRTKEAERENLEKERVSALSMAQVQAYRFNR